MKKSLQFYGLALVAFGVGFYVVSHMKKPKANIQVNTGATGNNGFVPTVEPISPWAKDFVSDYMRTYVATPLYYGSGT